MKPTHPVELLACAIATQEGWWDDNSIPQIRKNPGDLRFAGQSGAIRWESGLGGGMFRHGQFLGWYSDPIAMFPTNALGVTALFRQVWLQVAEGQTVRQIIAQWAPPNENNTSVYLENVLSWTGLPPDTPVLELLPPLVQLNVPTT